MHRGKQPQGSRTAIVVLGMHRSGSSFLSRSLNLVGAALPQTLIGASDHNSVGHYESQAVKTINDRILSACRSSWNDWRPVAFDTLSGADRAALVGEARDVVIAEFGAAPLFVLKDPRICRLMPFWDEVLGSLDIAVRPILGLRNPIEVAASLEARDGFAPDYSHFMWLRHMLDAEADSRGRARADQL